MKENNNLKPSVAKGKLPDNVILKLHNVKKSFGKKEVLKGIDLEIKRKEFVAIVGQNGAGKTTLIEIISRIQKKTSGDVFYNFLSKDPRKNIGAQFQEGNWPAGLTAHDILQFFKGIYRDVSSEKIAQLVEIFEIDEFIRCHLTKLSGGQKQRFNALLAILHDPDLVMFDEATTGLDIQLKYKFLNFIHEYSIRKDSNQTFLIVSHTPEEIEVLATRIVLVSDGIIFIDISVQEAQKKYGSIRRMLDLYFANKLPGNTVKGKKIVLHFKQQDVS